MKYAEEDSSLSDEVDHPSWYIGNGMETIDALRALSSKEEFASFCRLTAIQYLIRAGKKRINGESEREAMLRDAEKAKRYIDWLCEVLFEKKS